MAEGQVDTSADEMMGQMFGNVMREQQQADADFRKTMDDHRAQVEEVRAEAFRNAVMGGQKQAPQFSEEVLKIAVTLQQQPRLIPPVSNYLSYLMDEIGKAVDEITSRGYGG